MLLPRKMDTDCHYCIKHGNFPCEDCTLYYMSWWWWWYYEIHPASQRPFSFNSESYSILSLFYELFFYKLSRVQKGSRDKTRKSEGMGVMCDVWCVLCELSLYFIYLLDTRYLNFIFPFLYNRRSGKNWEENRSMAVSSSFQSTFILIFELYILLLFSWHEFLSAFFPSKRVKLCMNV